MASAVFRPPELLQAAMPQQQQQGFQTSTGGLGLRLDQHRWGLWAGTAGVVGIRERHGTESLDVIDSGMPRSSWVPATRRFPEASRTKLFVYR